MKSSDQKALWCFLRFNGRVPRVGSETPGQVRRTPTARTEALWVEWGVNAPGKFCENQCPANGANTHLKSALAPFVMWIFSPHTSWQMFPSLPLCLSAGTSLLKRGNLKSPTSRWLLFPDTSTPKAADGSPLTLPELLSPEGTRVDLPLPSYHWNLCSFAISMLYSHPVLPGKASLIPH